MRCRRRRERHRRPASDLLLKTHGSLRVASNKHVDAVIPETRDPDIAGSVRRQALRSQRSTLITVRLRHRRARRREARNTSVPIRRWVAGTTAAPAQVAEPGKTFWIDRDSESGTEQTSTGQRRHRRTFAAVRGLAIGFEHDDGVGRVGRSLHDVVRNPGVASLIEGQVAGATDLQALRVAAGVVDLDRDRPCIRHCHEMWRVRVTQQCQREDGIDVKSGFASEVRESFGRRARGRITR